MQNTKRTPTDNERAQLENEIVRLKKKIEKYEATDLKRERFGLVWLDVPEAFEDDVENKLPILEEVPKLAINSTGGKPTHLLIEGDNYHVLTCLNYTHKGKVDVIYIDPPYNTGSDGFKYKDKRILKEYPDGTLVPVENPFRHSYWLSFMKKRLELARDILSKKGLIFISIDDNEFVQLKLLCDEVFLEKNFVCNFIWNQKLTGGHDSKNINVVHEYVLCYAKDKAEENIVNKMVGETDYPLFDEEKKLNFKWDSLWTVSHGYTPNCDYPIIAKDGTKVYPWMCHKDKEKVKGIARWFWSKETYRQNKNEILTKKDKNGDWKVYKKVYAGTSIPYKSIFDKVIVGGTSSGKKALEEIFGKIQVFENPKSPELIKHIIKIAEKKDSIVLDFFAGSGTTGQAVMELNKQDNGKRQFILITNNDEITNGRKHKIMTDVCYPRTKSIAKNTDSSIRYFKTAFVGKNNILAADDADKIELAYKAGGLLAVAENTFDQVERNDHWQIFENEKQNTAVYFREEFSKFDDFIEKVRKLKKPTVVYIFSWEKEFEFNDFDDDKNIKVKTIPQPILEIYQQIYNLV